MTHPRIATSHGARARERGPTPLGRGAYRLAHHRWSVLERARESDGRIVGPAANRAQRAWASTASRGPAGGRLSAPPAILHGGLGPSASLPAPVTRSQQPPKSAPFPRDPAGRGRPRQSAPPRRKRQPRRCFRLPCRDMPRRSRLNRRARGRKPNARRYTHSWPRPTEV